jgi:hypothetical protein
MDRIIKNICTIVSHRKEYEKIFLEGANNQRIFTVFLDSFNQREISKKSSIKTAVDIPEEQHEAKEPTFNMISKRGGVMAIQELCKNYVSKLLDQIPSIWELSSAKLHQFTEIHSQPPSSWLLDDVVKLLQETEILSTFMKYIEAHLHDKVSGADFQLL